MENDKQKTISSASQKLLEQILAKKKRYVVKTDLSELRNLGSDPTVEELYRTIATLIKDLQKQQILK